MGGYLATHGLGGEIDWFYAVQGIVSLFMPALLGIVADRWIQAQKVLSLAHLLAGIFMIGAGAYAMSAGDAPAFWPLFLPYAISVAFFMPTIGLANSVAFNALTKAGMDTVKDFPPIRVFGTIGFICAMLTVDFTGMQHNFGQFFMHLVCPSALSTRMPGAARLSMSLACVLSPCSSKSEWQSSSSSQCC